MKTSRNLLVILLMAASLFLLLVLETLWLKKEYREEKTNFTNVTYFLFSNTIMTLQDSMLRRNMPSLQLENDTNGIPEVQIHDSPGLTPGLPPKEKTKFESVFRILRPIISKLSYGKFPSTFHVRISGDSIPMNILKHHFNNEMNEKGIQVPYTIQVIQGNTGKSWVYSVHFENMGIYAIEKIMPQVLFCAVLTLLIIISFYSLYRNIRMNQRLMELKNDFISHISHELKTPVATVSVAIEALRNFDVLKDPHKSMQYLEIASRELNRLDRIADQILSKMVSEQKGMNLKHESVDLNLLVLHVVDSMKLVLEKRKATVSFKDESRDHSVKGSEAQLRDVVSNLLDNAIKHSQPGVKIEISLKSDRRNIVLSIKDNGPGILPEYHKKIFEKFSRIPVGDVYNSKGYGLGLHYVKQVVESHHGTIDLVSKPGSGSTFTIRIPKAHE